MGCWVNETERRLLQRTVFDTNTVGDGGRGNRHALPRPHEMTDRTTQRQWTKRHTGSRDDRGDVCDHLTASVNPPAAQNDAHRRPSTAAAPPPSSSNAAKSIRTTTASTGSVADRACRSNTALGLPRASARRLQPSPATAANRPGPTDKGAAAPRPSRRKRRRSAQVPASGDPETEADPLSRRPIEQDEYHYHHFAVPAR